MVPMIRNLLGGFLFAGDDIYKKAGVLSGGERTRLAVARMLLKPANTLLLDEPTNHLDIDSKDVLLDALADFGGTLIFVSHDRYFVDRLATKIIAVGQGRVEIYPGTYEEYLWSKAQRALPTAPVAPRATVTASGQPSGRTPLHRKVTAKERPSPNAPEQRSYEEKKRADAETRRRRRADEERRGRITELEQRIAAHEAEIKAIEGQMTAATFYHDRAAADAAIARHQKLMWEVGDLMNRWETLQNS